MPGRDPSPDFPWIREFETPATVIGASPGAPARASDTCMTSARDIESAWMVSAEVVDMTGYRTRLVRGLLTAALVALVAVLPQAAEAFHRDTPFLTALSACPGGDSASTIPLEVGAAVHRLRLELRPAGRRAFPPTAATDLSRGLPDRGPGARPGDEPSQATSRNASLSTTGPPGWRSTRTGTSSSQNPSGQRQIFLRHKPTDATNPPTCSFVAADQQP